jgi:EAL domain-containing protein (putative c-di-GMP-specific phosphodiesterase class I)
MVARLGGDEFTIILNDLHEIGVINRIAQSILNNLAEPFQLGNETLYVTASIGITIFPADAEDIETLLKNADQAMYAAKQQGRNRYSYFTPSMQQEALGRMRTANDLRLALNAQQFVVYYQPIIELATGAIRKAEALIRWQHPVNGLILPSAFIPVAEETSLISEIGDFVFTQVAAQAIQWKLIRPDFQISLNKSPAQFRNEKGSHKKWISHLQMLGLQGDSIAVEITEGLLLDAHGSVVNQLYALRQGGIQIAIDDFGTGYSSLAYIKKFEIDYIKIDQTFTKSLGAASDALVLCEAIIVMAHKLDIKVIAEGVETPLQRDLLLAAGCDFAQGYLFSKPLPADEFDKLLSEQLSIQTNES